MGVAHIRTHCLCGHCLDWREQGEGVRVWTLRRNSKSWGRCGDAHPSLKMKNGRTRGRSNSRLPGHRVCLDLCQAKAVLPKRCLGVSFFPNPNALGRLVLVFCFFFCFALLFCDRVVVEGASSLFYFFRYVFCCFPWSTQWFWLFFAGWLCVLLLRNVFMWCFRCLWSLKLKQRTGVM